MLNFCRIITDDIEIPDEIIKEYIEECKNEQYTPEFSAGFSFILCHL